MWTTGLFRCPHIHSPLSHGGRLEVHGGRCLVAERLVRAFVVVERKVSAQAVVGFAWAGIFGEIHLLVFYAAPEALGENVVAATAPAIHADLHAGAQQQFGVLRAGEMTALVAVPNLGFGLR